MAKKKGRTTAGKNQFIMGALLGAAAAYFLLNQYGPAAPPPVRPIQPGSFPQLPADASLGALPPFAFRPRTKMYV